MSAKDYKEAEHLCDSCVHNIAFIRISPDEVTIVTDFEKPELAGTEFVVKRKPEYFHSCKIGLVNTPKVISCNQLRRKDR